MTKLTVGTINIDGLDTELFLKTSTDHNNSCTINVYNITKENRAKLNDCNASDRIFLELNDLRIDGFFKNVRHTKEVEWKTEIDLFYLK